MNEIAIFQFKASHFFVTFELIEMFHFKRNKVQLV